MIDNNSVTSSLEKDSIGTLLLRYSLPAIASMVIFSLYNIIDSIFIGHGVGPLAISALAVAFPIMNLIFAFGLLVGVGGASVSSLRMGQNNLPSTRLVLGNVLVLSIITGIGFGVLCYIFLDPILLLFGASPDTLPYAHDFMKIILIGLPISYVMFNLNHVMRATGYPSKAFFSAVVTVAVNIVLAPLFIFHFDWGIRGAAWATVFSQCVGMIWVLLHFFSAKSFIHFQKGTFGLSKNIVGSIFAIGMSPFLMNVCACAVAALINTLLKDYGGDMAIGAFGILNRILIFFVMVVIGLSQGMQPIIGYNYGAMNIDRVKLTLKYGIVSGMCITTLGCIISQVYPESITALFTTDASLSALSVAALHMATFMFPLVGCQIVIGNFFQSIGRPKLSIFISLTRQLLFLIPCLLVLPYFWGLNGIWLSLPISDALAFFTAIAILMKGLRQAEMQKMKLKLHKN